MRQEYSDSLAHKDTVIDISKKHTFDLMNSLVSEFKALSTQQEIETIDKIKAAKDKCIFDSRNYVGSVLNKPEATTVISQNSVSNDQSDERLKVKLLRTQNEVIKLHKLLKQQRLLWMLKFQSNKLKQEDEMQILKNKLTSNQALWSQLEDSDKRTKIL